MNTLLISSGAGIFWLVFLFALCFGAVHILKLAKYGQEFRKQAQKPQTPEPEKPTPAEKKTPPPEAREPIYYIVERKRKTKSSFSETNEIRFK